MAYSRSSSVSHFVVAGKSGRMNLSMSGFVMSTYMLENLHSNSSEANCQTTLNCSKSAI